MSEAIDKARAAHGASVVLAQASASLRSKAILAAANAVSESRSVILEANGRDMERGGKAGMPGPLLDRLMLDDARIDGIVAGMREVASQADPIGEVVGGRTLASGIRLTQVRVPLGVVAMVYEARPNVTADAICLALRSGNAVVLRGGTAAHDSCEAIAQACRDGIASAGLPRDCACIIDSSDRAETRELMHANGLIDVLIPRGGHSLIRTCVEQATVPVIQTGEGNCHVYVHTSADLDMAISIIENAKTQRPGVCNAIETVLVDEDVSGEFLPRLVSACRTWGVMVHGDETALAACAESGLNESSEYVAATEDDWAREYDSLDLAVHVVSGLDAAIEHINRFGTQHSECIVARDVTAAEAFLARVDAAAVYVNASTRFTDGGMFGLGAEIGISTQKLHARGPMGAFALTTTKCLLRGDGQVRA
ncbi:MULTISPECIES: glutamate-5-semialdehyde dehydrogenase [unclassified Collinsella]|uniref:glutamate-5-semialdehyde dehydrogenase n=1 Tax=unclassified Collinsella TaxID=2637548 RepID=UPI00319EB4D8